MPSPPSSKQRRRDTAGGGLLEHALLEVRPRLQSAYCFLRLTVDTADPTFRVISVQTRGDRPGLDVCLEFRGRTYTEPVEVDCRLAALSGGVNVAGRYVVMRATLEPDERTGSTAAEIMSAPVQRKTMPLWRPEVPSQYCATCRQCGAAVVDARFHRALPLPSEFWREMLGNVFCHGDGADRDIHKRVRARPGDCFYSASHVVLSAEDINCDVSGSRLTCARCSAPLGETVEFGARLWHHRLTWSRHGVQELKLEPGQVLRRLLVHGASLCDAPAARLLATAPRHEPLLLWLIDTGLSVHEVRSGKEADECEEDDEDSDCGVTSGNNSGVTNPGNGESSNGAIEANGCNGAHGSLNETAGPASRTAKPKKSPGRARTAVKILYRRCDEESARQHRADLSVKGLELDEALMAALRAELERSQRWYPELQRTQGDDQVGLIIL